jgi:nucleotide-binding universal stress UspA family protein
MAQAAYRKILLCYDGRRESRDALRQGGELAAALGAETHVLLVSSVIHNASAYAAVTELQVDVENSACKKILQEGLEWLRERGVEATPHVVLGTPIEVIPRIARELNIDLIVVGHVARSALGRWWAGPENASLLDRVRCCVLVTVA